jgi:hypothetical protein
MRYYFLTVLIVSYEMTPCAPRDCSPTPPSAVSNLMCNMLTTACKKKSKKKKPVKVTVSDEL